MKYEAINVKSVLIVILIVFIALSLLYFLIYYPSIAYGGGRGGCRDYYRSALITWHYLGRETNRLANIYDDVKKIYNIRNHLDNESMYYRYGYISGKIYSEIINGEKNSLIAYISIYDSKYKELAHELNQLYYTMASLYVSNRDEFISVMTRNNNTLSRVIYRLKLLREKIIIEMSKGNYEDLTMTYDIVDKLLKDVRILQRVFSP